MLLGALDGVLKPVSLPGSMGVVHAKDGHGGGGGGDGGGGRGGGDDGGRGSDDGGRGKDGRDDSSGRDDRSGRRDDDSGREARSVGRFMDRLAKHGHVAWSRIAPGSVSVRYADGWTETVENGRYSLRDRTRRTVAERAARAGDTARLRAAAKAR